MQMQKVTIRNLETMDKYRSYALRLALKFSLLTLTLFSLPKQMMEGRLACNFGLLDTFGHHWAERLPTIVLSKNFVYSQGYFTRDIEKKGSGHRLAWTSKLVKFHLPSCSDWKLFPLSSMLDDVCCSLEVNGPVPKFDWAQDAPTTRVAASKLASQEGAGYRPCCLISLLAPPDRNRFAK